MDSDILTIQTSFEVGGFARGRKSLRGTKAQEAAENLAKAQRDFSYEVIGYRNGLGKNRMIEATKVVQKMVRRAGAAIRDYSETEYQEIEPVGIALIAACERVIKGETNV